MKTEIKSKLKIKTPVEKKDIESLRIGDEFYIDGTIVTCRDAAHRRFLEDNKALPVAPSVIFHAGPIVSKGKVISIGPTTSMRMERYEYDFIKRTGVKVIIGKGTMGEKTAQACKEFGAIHAIFPGGCSVYAAERVKSIESVFWSDLGMPEALWVLKVEDFGPLFVSIDSGGKKLFRG